MYDSFCLGEGSSNPLQYSCLENSMDWGAGRLQSMGSQRVGNDWMTSSSFFFSFSFCLEYHSTHTPFLILTHPWILSLYIASSRKLPWLRRSCWGSPAGHSVAPSTPLSLLDPIHLLAHLPSLIQREFLEVRGDLLCVISGTWKTGSVISPMWSQCFASRPMVVRVLCGHDGWATLDSAAESHSRGRDNFRAEVTWLPPPCPFLTQHPMYGCLPYQLPTEDPPFQSMIPSLPENIPPTLNPMTLSLFC